MQFAYNLEKRKRTLFILPIVLAIIAAIGLPYLPFLIVGLLVLLLIFIYKIDFILILITLGFITATGPELAKIRPLINLISIGLTAFIFFKFYDFDINNYPIIPAPFIKYFIVLFTTLIISTVFSQNFSVSIIAVFQTLVFFIICYLFYGILFKLRDIYLYIYAIFFSVLVLFATILIQIAESGFTLFLFKGEVARFSGIYSNPNYVGLILIISTSFLISFFFREKFRSGIRLFILIVFLLINLFLLFIVDSRASILALFFSGSYILFSLNKRLYFKLLISVLILCGVLLLMSPVQQFVDIYLRLDRFNTRAYFWQTGFDVIRDYPIFGIGPDIFDSKIFTYLPSAALNYFSSDSWVGKKASPHNFFLLMMSENGILGLVISIGLFAVIFYYCVRAIKLTKRIKEKDPYLLSISITGIVIGVFVRAFYEVTGIFSYGYITRDLPLWLLISIILFINVKYSGNELRKIENH